MARTAVVRTDDAVGFTPSRGAERAKGVLTEPSRDVEEETSDLVLRLYTLA